MAHDEYSAERDHLIHTLKEQRRVNDEQKELLIKLCREHWLAYSVPVNTMGDRVDHAQSPLAHLCISYLVSEDKAFVGGVGTNGKVHYRLKKGGNNEASLQAV